MDCEGFCNELWWNYANQIRLYILLPGARLGCVYIADQWALTPWSSRYLHRGGRCTSLDGSDFKTLLKMKKLRTIFALMIMNEYLLIVLIRSRVIVLKDLPYKVLKVVSFGIFLRDYSQSWIHGKPIKGFSRLPGCLEQDAAHNPRRICRHKSNLGWSGCIAEVWGRWI